MELSDSIPVEHIPHDGKDVFQKYRKGHVLDKLIDLQYLWTTDKDKYYLEILDGMFCIMDKNNMMLLVEDDELYILAIEKMIFNGVKVIERDNIAKNVLEVPPQIAIQKYKLFKDSV